MIYFVWLCAFSISWQGRQTGFHPGALPATVASWRLVLSHVLAMFLSWLQRQRKLLRFAASDDKDKRSKWKWGWTHRDRKEREGGWWRRRRRWVSLKKEEAEEKKTKKTGGKCVKCRNRQLAISQFGTFGISFLFSFCFSLRQGSKINARIDFRARTNEPSTRCPCADCFPSLYIPSFPFSLLFNCKNQQMAIALISAAHVHVPWPLPRLWLSLHTI